MKLKTFFNIYFRHRIKKANLILKLYLYLNVLIRYLLNLNYFEKKINIDELDDAHGNLFNQDINYLFEYFNSDKGQTFIDQYPEPFKRRKNKNKIEAHGYSIIYEKYFKPYKNKTINILELGSFYGNASAAMFFYFKNANIYGADINPDMFKYTSRRIKSLYVNSSSRESIYSNLIKKNIAFSIIIEDASHMLKDQILSLFMLFKKLESGGLFVIEEIDFPEKRLDMRINQKAPDLKTILKSILLNKNFYTEYINEDEKKYFIQNYSSIEFFKGNINEMAIIRKK
tara:strand:- start:943 stop:1797 length:855 start_codon:yes stop_codon:yes gene_type:complete